MQITKLSAENVKRIKAVTINPDGATVVVGGRNGQGKSSVLDSIAYALEGTAAVPAEPIRHGQKSAKIILETEDLVVTRKFTPSGSTLEVTNKDGAKFPSPQAVLDKLCAKIAFDPLAFIRLGETKEGRRTQLKQLRDLVGLDTSEIDRQREVVFAERTGVNRRVSELEVVVAALPKEGPPVVDVVALMDRFNAATKHNIDVAEQNKKLDHINGSIVTAETDIELIGERIKAIRSQLAKAEEELGKKKAEIVTLEKMATDQEDHVASMKEIPVDDIQAKIISAQANNKSAMEFEQAKVKRAELDRLRNESDKLSDKIGKLDEQKHDLIRSAKFPVPGLICDDAGIKFNGTPLDQCSSAEQLRIGLAIAIGMNPKMKVMLIRDGSLLDEDSLAIVAEMAEASDSQVWIERVSDGAECTVVIEDGMVVGGGE